MPYKDPEKTRAYHREYKRIRRSGESITPGQTLIPLPFRMKTAQDILALLADQVQAVRDAPKEEAGTLEKARCIGYLCGIALKAVEVSDLDARLAAMEQVLKTRRSTA
jgi:hypothetical protein